MPRHERIPQDETLAASLLEKLSKKPQEPPPPMRGLYNKYKVAHADGSPTDPDAVYIVLRVDSGEYVHACRAGALAFAREVRPANPQLAGDLEDLVARLDNQLQEEKHAEKHKLGSP